MHERSRAVTITCFAATFAVLSLMCRSSALAQDAKPSPEAAKQLPNSPDEPIRASVSMTEAATFLDDVALNWTRQHKCGTCHTNYPYLVARPVLKERASPAMAEVRRFFEERVAHWDDAAKEAKPRWDAEVVSTAAALAMNDAETTGNLHPRTREALDRIWSVQKADGGFNWLKCDWPPLEYDDYYGAVVAALGVGYAPEGYAHSPAAQAGLKRLRAYFAKNQAPNLHHQTMLMWASTRLEGLMREEDKRTTIARLRQIQRPDGGWNLPSLGEWTRRDGSANDVGAPSDGYATGCVVLVLRESGIPAADPSIKRAVAWLRSNQRASGRWFTRSLNRDGAHYIANAGTAFAVLALKSCESADGRTADRAKLSAAP
jgi:squalene-hopene/tetraprenyl-beta-curcumene cyclase